MKGVKWLLLGIAVILFGGCAVLLAGLQGTPTYNNGLFQLIGLIAPFAGLLIAVIGFFRSKSGE